MSLEVHIASQVLRDLSPPATQMSLNESLRLLCKWRCLLVQDQFLQQHGTTVIGGPFAGMDFLTKSAEGCHIPKLLGCYEQPLHAFIEQAIGRAYRNVVNVGSAEGYYAVGMAIRMPSTEVFAYDQNRMAQEVCEDLARKNGVSSRVSVGKTFDRSDFSIFVGKKTLVVCDIEGAELELLDPTHSPALLGMDLIVESHECLIPGVTQALIERFKQSHAIELVRDAGLRTFNEMPDWFFALPHLDQLIATWEWRSGPTPWLVMHSVYGP